MRNRSGRGTWGRHDTKDVRRKDAGREQATNGRPHKSRDKVQKNDNNRHKQASQPKKKAKQKNKGKKSRLLTDVREARVHATTGDVDVGMCDRTHSVAVERRVSRQRWWS